MNKHLVHAVFEQKVLQRKNEIAIEYAGKQLSYDKLNRAANKVAHTLIKREINRGQVIGAFFKCNLEYISAILGINKASGTFMPLETDFPVKRLISLLELAAPEILITCSEYLPDLVNFLQNNFSDSIAQEILCVDMDMGTLSLKWFNQQGKPLGIAPSVDESDPALMLDGDDTNYIFYTSGSTSVPKCIEGCHKSLSHFIHWEINEFNVTESCKVSQLSPISFDVSLRDIFVPLLSGGTLCIPDKDTRFHPALLVKWIAASRISIVHCVPSVLRLLTEELRIFPCRTDLQLVILAGEALFEKDVLNWQAVAGTWAELVNVYGPTETTLAKMYYRIPKELKNASSIIPLGKAISNTVIMILKDGRLCEIGEPGEIYIKTPFRSKGYYRNEILTREKFIQNPLNTDKDIIYRTGDWGRYDENMQVLFMGREDNQIKINGNRVEMQEIENVLADIKGIRQAVIKAYTGHEAEKFLVCYYSGDEGFDEREFTKHLRDRLPEYMFPSRYVRMDKLPLNRNGKIDRAALPDVETEKTSSYDAPAGELETKLEEVLMEVLGLPRVSRNASFFDIGWSSLKGIKIIARIFKKFNIMIKLPDLFTHPSIVELSAFLSGALKEPFEEIRPLSPDEPDYPVSSSQKRLWILNQFQDDSTAYNTFYAWQLHGQVNAPALIMAFSSIVERHESLRTVFTLIGGEPMQKILPVKDLPPVLEELDLIDDEQQQENIARIIQQEAEYVFDLAIGPLMKAKLVRLNENKFILLLTFHHIISDGWSMNVFIYDLLKLYDAYSSGSEPALRPLKFQYKDFAVWQNKLLTGARLKEHQDYWMTQFSGNLPLIELPWDKLRPVVKTFRGALTDIRFPEHITAGLQNLSRLNESTLFMTILASVKVLFHKYSGQEDVIVGIPVAGREHADLDNQIGLFINTLAIRTRMKPDDTFNLLLLKVKESMLGAYKYQAYPFDHLVDDLQLAKDPGRSALFDVLVAFHDTKQIEQEKATPPLKGVNVSRLMTDRKVSKFDCSFNFVESDGGLNLQVEYNTDLFTEGRIKDMLDHLSALFCAIVKEPERGISDLDFVPENKKEIILNKGVTIISGYHSKDNKVIDKYLSKNKARPGTSLLILDTMGRILPDGVSGEIYVSVDGNDALLLPTGEVGMLQNYKVRYIGNIKSERPFLGGRINLDYILHHILSYPGIDSAATEVVTGISGKETLVACLISEEEIDNKELSAYLALHIPGNMIPERYFISRQGRLPDTLASWQELLQNDMLSQGETTTFLAPRNHTEIRLVEMVTPIIGLERISIKDNFFSAGVQSLKIMRLIAAIYKEWGVRIDLVRFLAAPTVENLAQMISASDTVNFSNSN